MVLNLVIKRNIYRFGKNEIFENILPFKSENYFHKLLTTKQSFYLGIDPTANSLQIGNLFPLIALLRINRTGHDIIVLVGGGTARIGDPSGRLTDRVGMSDDAIGMNVACVKRDIDRIVGHFRQNFIDGSRHTIGNYRLVDNREWIEQTDALSFTTRVLSRFKFDEIRQARSFESRFSSENSISISELIYPFFQANDWLHLYRQFGCQIQIGGDDQQGNIIFGRELIERIEKVKVYGLTVPLFCVDGIKVGKSTQSSHLKMWLNPEVQSPYSLYSSLTHVSNSIIINNNLLKRLTLLEDEDIKEILQRHELKPKDLILQMTLANNVLKLVHGSEILSTVQSTNELFALNVPQLIEQKIASIDEANPLIKDNHISHVPHIPLNQSCDKSMSIKQLADATESIINQNKANKDNKNTDVKFNGEKIEDFNRLLNSSALERKVCGVLQIGSGSKWIVHFI